MSTYKATVTREAALFVIDVAGVGVTQAEHQSEVDEMARDLVHLVTGEALEDIEVCTS